MKPPSTAVSDRLLTLLYKKAAPQIATKVPIVSKVLYDLDPNETHGSALDNLLERQWEQKPMEDAVQDAKKTLGDLPLTNILRFACKNAYVGGDDLRNIFPINRERNYYLDKKLRKGFKFLVVKARNPVNLLFTGAYYLVFPNLNQASVYYLETKGKLINGFDLKLEFVQPVDKHLRRMSSPYLESNNKSQVSYEKAAMAPLLEIFTASQSHILQQLLRLDDGTAYMGEDEAPSYPLLSSFMATSKRYRLVLVKNLPYGLSSHTIPNLLWDYDIDNPDDPLASITELFSDPTIQVHLTLIRFANEASARRFVRNYHGRRWDNIQSRKEKAVYSPILCEIVD